MAPDGVLGTTKEVLAQELGTTKEVLGNEGSPREVLGLLRTRILGILRIFRNPKNLEEL